MDLLLKTINAIKPVSDEWRQRAAGRLSQQVRPRGSLGRLETLAQRLAAIRHTLRVPTQSKQIVTMAGDHGVVAEGVSAYPQEVTGQMVAAFAANAASINALAECVGAEVEVVDVGVATELSSDLPILHKRVRAGTDNITKGPAMSRDDAVRCVEVGIEVVHEVAGRPAGLDLLGTGDMGIGNTTPSSAIIAVYSDRPVAELVGRGTGIDDDALARKRAAVKRALEVNQPDPDDPIDVLAKVGGCEIGALAGAVLAAAARSRPVVCDGLIATAGALLACELCPTAKQYLFTSHLSVEVGHQAMLARLSLDPLLDLGMRLGEGTGAALAMFLLEAAARALANIKTFKEMGVSDTGK